MTALQGAAVSPSLPLPPPDLFELAAWFAEHELSLREIDAARRRLRDFIRDEGPQRTPHGVVRAKPAGLDYDVDAIAMVMPSAVRCATITAQIQPTADGDALTRASRAASLIGEELPGTEVSVVLSVDPVLVKSAIRDGGAIAAKLEPLVTQKSGSLEVRRG